MERWRDVWSDRGRGGDEGIEPTRQTGRYLNKQQLQEMMNGYMPERREGDWKYIVSCVFIVQAAISVITSSVIASLIVITLSVIYYIIGCNKHGSLHQFVNYIIFSVCLIIIGQSGIFLRI